MPTDTHILISLGSNHLPNAHIRWASGCLATLFEDVRFSDIIWTQDVKGSGHWYMNRLAACTTQLTVEEIEQKLKAIEQKAHRTKEHVTIDLDLMQYGTGRFHDRDW